MSEQTSKLLSLLMLDEGFKPYVYQDSTPQKYLTIGYGRLVDRRGGGISKDEGLYLLQNDIADRIQALSAYAWFSTQDDVRQIALADMAFNLGIQGLLHFPEFLSCMLRKDYPGAVAQLTNTPWHTQTGDRAVRIETMVATGTYPVLA